MQNLKKIYRKTKKSSIKSKKSKKGNSTMKTKKSKKTKHLLIDKTTLGFAKRSCNCGLDAIPLKIN